MEYNLVIDRVQSILIADSQTHDFFYVPKAHFCDCYTGAASVVSPHKANDSSTISYNN